MTESNVFQKMGVAIETAQITGCGHLSAETLLNDSFLECFIKSAGITSVHMSSSCRMGSRDDPLSVVDPQLRLLGGVKNVRVMDASIMPQVTRGNTNAPTVMIAAKGSQMLINSHTNNGKN